MDHYKITLWILLGLLHVSHGQNTASIVQPFKTTSGLVGSSVTLTTTIQKSTKDDLVMITFLRGSDIWKEGTGYLAGRPDEVNVSSAVNPDTLVGVYNVTVQLPDNKTRLTGLSVPYKAMLVSNTNVDTTARIHALDPVSCKITGDPIKQPDEQVNITCHSRYYGRTSPSLSWYGLWFEHSHQKIFSDFGLDGVGDIYTVIGRRAVIEDDGKPFKCEMYQNRLRDTCQVSYKVMSCNTSTRCIVKPFRNQAGKMGHSVTLSSTFRKQSVSDTVAITYDPQNAPGTVIWEEGKQVMPPAGITVKHSVDPTSLIAVYNVTIQLPVYDHSNYEEITNLTVAYSAYMTSEPSVKTTAKVVAVDNLTCNVRADWKNIKPGFIVRMSCDTEYFGYKIPTLDWYNQTGAYIRSSSRSHVTPSGPVAADISHSASAKDNDKIFQCRMSFDKNEFDFFPPQYQDTCNVSFSVLYGVQCSISGSANKRPGDPVEMTCTTMYDGVNLPLLNWYGSKISSKTKMVNNVTNEYKVVLTTTAGEADMEYMCKLIHKYWDPFWNSTKNVNQRCFQTYNVKRDTSSATTLVASVCNMVLLATLIQTLK